MSCTFCTGRGFHCTVEQKPLATPATPATPAAADGYEPLGTAVGHQAHPISSVSLTPDRDLCNDLVDLYFRYIHVTFHNLFHRPSFEASVRDGSIPKILLFGVFGLSSRFSCHPSFANVDPKERGRAYTREAERLLDLHKTCLTTIQACVLLGAIQVVEMDSATESIFYTIACRMAMILNLPNAPAKTRIEQEVNLRVWWSVVATDTWSSTALGLPRAIQPHYDNPMPMDERVFLRLTPAEPSDPLQQRLDARSGSQLSTSLIAQMIKLNGILYDINTFNTKAVSGVLETPTARDLSVAELSAALDAWRSELPVDMEYTADNLQYWANHGCGASFVVLHLNFHHAGQLLFYSFLHSSLTSDSHRHPSSSPATSTNISSSSSSSSSNSAHYAARCRSHAARLCEIMHSACGQEDDDAPNTTADITTTTNNNNNNSLNSTSSAAQVRHPLAGHMLVVASTVHMYALLFGTDDAEIALARARLEHNFRIISRLQGYWPSLHASFSRLTAFHAACLGRGGGGSGDSGSGNNGSSSDGMFRLDRWMLRFLLDFAKPVDVADRDMDCERERGDWEEGVRTRY